ncbi:Glutamine-rich protein 2 [Labeo rohita]|uniref:Glutamine-rich protein 2 n=1 Tax=Labeo rohita TaxID=84645 RepID=A0ABQ8LH07_LABRO|nr:Glutamine-rich protein 2 [Labeo rohita]
MFTNPTQRGLLFSSQAQRWLLFPHLAQGGPQHQSQAQRGLLSPHSPQRGLLSPSQTQRGLLFPHLAHGGPRIPSQGGSAVVSLVSDPKSSPERAPVPTSSTERDPTPTLSPERAAVPTSRPGRDSDPKSSPERAPLPMTSTVAAVESFKFLGTTISQDLKWDIHIDCIVKKGPAEVAIPSSAKTVQPATAKRTIGVHLTNLQDLYNSRVKKQAGNIIKDCSYPGYNVGRLGGRGDALYPTHGGILLHRWVLLEDGELILLSIFWRKELRIPPPVNRPQIFC